MGKGNLLNKVWEQLGFRSKDEYLDGEDVEGQDSDIQYEDSYDGVEDTDEIESSKSFFGRKNAQRSEMPTSYGASQVKMIIQQPTDFDEASEICKYLKQRKSIVMNLEYANKDVARRIVDCVSGAVVVLDGKILKISNSIFLVAPSNYDIEEESNEDARKSPLSAFMNNK